MPNKNSATKLARKLVSEVRQREAEVAWREALAERREINNFADTLPSPPPQIWDSTLANLTAGAYSWQQQQPQMSRQPANGISTRAATHSMLPQPSSRLQLASTLQPQSVSQWSNAQPL